MSYPESYDEAYTVAEAAQRLRMSEVHLRRLIKEGDLKVKRVGSRILVPSRSIVDFLDGPDVPHRGPRSKA